MGAGARAGARRRSCRGGRSARRGPPPWAHSATGPPTRWSGARWGGRERSGRRRRRAHHRGRRPAPPRVTSCPLGPQHARQSDGLPLHTLGARQRIGRDHGDPTAVGSDSWLDRCHCSGRARMSLLDVVVQVLGHTHNASRIRPRREVSRGGWTTPVCQLPGPSTRRRQERCPVRRAKGRRPQAASSSPRRTRPPRRADGSRSLDEAGDLVRLERAQQGRARASPSGSREPWRPVARRKTRRACSGSSRSTTAVIGMWLEAEPIAAPLPAPTWGNAITMRVHGPWRAQMLAPDSSCQGRAHRPRSRRAAAPRRTSSRVGVEGARAPAPDQAGPLHPIRALAGQHTMHVALVHVEGGPPRRAMTRATPVQCRRPAGAGMCPAGRHARYMRYLVMARLRPGTVTSAARVGGSGPGGVPAGWSGAAVAAARSCPGVARGAHERPTGRLLTVSAVAPWPASDQSSGQLAPRTRWTHGTRARPASANRPASRQAYYATPDDASRPEARSRP